ncbi:MAG: MarR family winged helix-turn-helix transcriptional regulator [Sphaerotilus natans subsp. sulfidivorans]|uniref:MarR family winged helix-turn-helix transcriptional regulator n=1 Tax=Sphaerotilus sulfidivorans TaxID=639200 RepID=UPI0023574B4D|nr:MarR family winged helix-turn-helix transcriptional regulator [Sphaerotilus sulfidivorans]MCK6401366.1 MarR family winged helix-turn-helix transcriptional regulator [Sphaerotilus sulfidivorans]
MSTDAPDVSDLLSDLTDDATPAGRLHEGALFTLLGYQLAQAAVTTTEVFEARVGGVHALRPVEYTILMLVGGNTQVSPTRLARALAVTLPNIKMWLDRMEGRGLVLRERSVRDRRIQHVTLTEAGAALAAQATAQLQQGDREVLEGFSPGERLLLVELLHRIARAREARRLR